MKMILPSLDDLSRLYFELGQIGARAVGEKKSWQYELNDKESLFFLATQWSRLDPRLLQIVVNYAIDRWRELRAWRLREVMKLSSVPQVVGVVAAFAMAAKPADREMALSWNHVITDMAPIEPQYFFMGVHGPTSPSAIRAAGESLVEFQQWGFLGNERIVIDPMTKRRIGSWTPLARHHVLSRLFAAKEKISISDYLHEIDESISRQQAILDLKRFGAVPHGRGRGAVWKVENTPKFIL